MRWKVLHTHARQTLTCSCRNLVTTSTQENVIIFMLCALFFFLFCWKNLLLQNNHKTILKYLPRVQPFNNTSLLRSEERWLRVKIEFNEFLVLSTSWQVLPLFLSQYLFIFVLSLPPFSLSFILCLLLSLSVSFLSVRYMLFPFFFSVVSILI